VKNLYDVAGLPTIAGSHIDRNRAPAAEDAALARRLAAAGAVLLGALITLSRLDEVPAR
jgi:Asp-tRNA(Asn)/Glu-tRNA(Gln) amidotransferase A subunit family amidase